MSESDTSPKLDFIREIIADDLATGKHATIITRFPPEPNGYLHIGHAKSICLNFGIALENAAIGAKCHLRFDDTNPEKEEGEYVESIKTDVKWLGFDWGEDLYFASDYFQFFHDCAVHLIKEGKAYVEDDSAEEMRVKRGNLTTPGTRSASCGAHGGGKPQPCSQRCAPASSRKANACCARGSTWRRPT